MSKFLLEPTASMAIGNLCAFCNTHKHERGFVNLLINDRPADNQGPRGRLYACAGCVDEMTSLVGGLEPRKAQELRDIADELGETAERLRGELQEAADNRVVPLAEVIDLVRERDKRRPKTPASVA